MNAKIANAAVFMTRLLNLSNISGISKGFSTPLARDFAPRRLSAVNRNTADYIVLGGFPSR